MKNRNRNTEKNPAVYHRKLWAKIVFHYQKEKLLKGNEGKGEMPRKKVLKINLN